MELGPNQRRWLEALRSGQYVQGREMLHSADEKYCCLGVACELFIPETGRYGGYAQTFALPHPTECYSYGEEHETGAAPKELYEHLGFRCGIADRTDALTSMNDAGVTFEEIAGMIEEDPGKYFERSM